MLRAWKAKQNKSKKKNKTKKKQKGQLSRVEDGGKFVHVRLVTEGMVGGKSIDLA